jgi:hypothetical protein
VWDLQSRTALLLGFAILSCFAIVKPSCGIIYLTDYDVDFFALQSDKVDKQSRTKINNPQNQVSNFLSFTSISV